jgi:hypothetical protein
MWIFEEKGREKKKMEKTERQVQTVTGTHRHLSVLP